MMQSERESETETEMEMEMRIRNSISSQTRTQAAAGLLPLLVLLTRQARHDGQQLEARGGRHLVAGSLC